MASGDSLGEADEVLVVSVHVGQLAVDQHHDLVLALLLLLPEYKELSARSIMMISQQQANLTFSGYKTRIIKNN